MKPYQITIPDSQLDDLARRLRHSRLPGAIFHDGNEDGASLALVRQWPNTGWSVSTGAPRKRR